MHPNTITPARISRIVELVGQFNGTITRKDLCQMTKFSASVMSVLVNTAIERGLIVSTGFSRGHQAVLSLAVAAPNRNWFEGWGGAVSLGLKT